MAHRPSAAGSQSYVFPLISTFVGSQDVASGQCDRSSHTSNVTLTLKPERQPSASSPMLHLGHKKQEYVLLIHTGPRQLERLYLGELVQTNGQHILYDLCRQDSKRTFRLRYELVEGKRREVAAELAKQSDYTQAMKLFEQLGLRFRTNPGSPSPLQQFAHNQSPWPVSQTSRFSSPTLISSPYSQYATLHPQPTQYSQPPLLGTRTSFSPISNAAPTKRQPTLSATLSTGSRWGSTPPQFGRKLDETRYIDTRSPRENIFISQSKTSQHGRNSPGLQPLPSTNTGSSSPRWQLRSSHETAPHTVLNESLRASMPPGEPTTRPYLQSSPSLATPSPSQQDRLEQLRAMMPPTRQLPFPKGSQEKKILTYIQESQGGSEVFPSESNAQRISTSGEACTSGSVQGRPLDTKVSSSDNQISDHRHVDSISATVQQSTNKEGRAESYRSTTASSRKKRPVKNDSQNTKRAKHSTMQGTNEPFPNDIRIIRGSAVYQNAGVQTNKDIPVVDGNRNTGEMSTTNAISNPRSEKIDKGRPILRNLRSRQIPDTDDPIGKANSCAKAEPSLKETTMISRGTEAPVSAEAYHQSKPHVETTATEATQVMVDVQDAGVSCHIRSSTHEKGTQALISVESTATTCNLPLTLTGCVSATQTCSTNNTRDVETSGCPLKFLQADVATQTERELMAADEGPNTHESQSGNSPTSHSFATALRLIDDARAVILEHVDKDLDHLEDGQEVDLDQSMASMMQDIQNLAHTAVEQHGSAILDIPFGSMAQDYFEKVAAELAAADT